MERALMSPVGFQFLVNVAPRIDKVLIPRTNGRLSSAGTNVVGLVATTGAKSGQPRPQPLTLIDDSGGLLAIGSNYGRPKHPAWSNNLLAHPECTVEFRVRRRSTGLSCSPATPAPRHGPPLTSTPAMSSTAPAARRAKSGSSAFVLSPRERNQCRLSRTLYVEGHDFRDSSPVSGVPIPPTLTL